MSNGSKLLVVGLKESGKTSFLAALWHLVEAGELPAALKVARLQPNREYLNRIRSSWLSFEEVGRTPMREQTLSLHLVDSASGELIDITLPDLSGELFRQQWEMRQASKSYAEFAASISGLLLFVHSTSLKRTQRLTGARTQHDEASSPVKEWAPESAPTQVQLVELLQFVHWLRADSSSFRICIIVSAWDQMRENLSPSFWVEQRLPFLHQYLVANRVLTPFSIFGVSALGGDLKRDIEAMRKESIPTRRIKVVDEQLNAGHDLTAPLGFLLGRNLAATP